MVHAYFNNQIVLFKASIYALNGDHMNHDTSYLHTNYAREKSIESYNREEKEKLTAKEKKGATARAGIMLPPAPEKEDDETSN